MKVKEVIAKNNEGKMYEFVIQDKTYQCRVVEVGEGMIDIQERGTNQSITEILWLNEIFEMEFEEVRTMTIPPYKMR